MNRPAGDINEGEAEPAALAGTVVRGATLSGAGYALAQVLTLATYVVLARLVTPAEFGQLVAGMLLVGLARLYTESGMLSALVYQRDRIEEAAATAVVSTFVAGLGFSLVALALSPVIALIFDSDTVGGVAAAVSGVVFLRTMSVVPEALLQRRFSFLRRMIVEPAAVLAFGVTAVILASNGLGVWALVIGQYASGLVDVVLSWGFVRWRPRLRLASFGMWRELISYGRHTVAATTVIRVGDEVPVFLLGRFAGTDALGQFRYGLRIAALPLAMIMASASYVLFPAFARISHERERFHAAILRALRWIAILAVPGGLILIPLGEPLATLAFGSIWNDAGKAAMALAFFTAGRGLTSLIGETMKAHGRPDVVVRMNVIEVTVGATAMVALSTFGLIGIAIGVSIGVVVRAIYAFYRMRDVVGLPLATTLAAIRAPLVAGVALVAILLPLELLVIDAASHGTALGLGLLAAEAALGIGIYATVLHLLVPSALVELVGMLKSMRRKAAG